MCLYSVPGPVGSVSSITDTTWAVISWIIPSYIPQAYPIIRYEIGYHHLNDKCCFMADVDDINIQVLNRSNVSSDSTFIYITDLNDNTCYIFGVRAYTINGPGSWTVIANETLPLPLVTTLTETGIHKFINSMHDIYFFIFSCSYFMSYYYY